MKYDPRPDWWQWWDDGPNRIHRADGTRYSHRIDYLAIPLHREFWDIPGIHSGDSKRRLNARKLLWRRLRHGYYDRHYERHAPKPPPQFDKRGQFIRDPVPVPLCCARRGDGKPCQARTVVNKYTGRPSTRCKWHGGHSTGPRTAAGKAASLAALARGRATRSSRCAT